MAYNQYIDDLLTYYEDNGAFDTAKYYRMSVSAITRIYKENYYQYRVMDASNTLVVSKN